MQTETDGESGMVVKKNQRLDEIVPHTLEMEYGNRGQGRARQRHEYLQNNSQSIGVGKYNGGYTVKGHGMSVRCIKD